MILRSSYEKYSSGQGATELHRLVTGVATVGLALYGHRISQTTDTELSSGSKLVAATHELGPLDVIGLGKTWMEATGQPLRFMYKREYEANQRIKLLFQALGGLPVTRGATEFDELKRAVRSLRAGADVGIFPSGRHTFGGLLGEPQLDVGKLAKMGRAEVVIAGIFGPHQQELKKPRSVHVHYQPFSGDLPADLESAYGVAVNEWRDRYS